MKTKISTALALLAIPWQFTKGQTLDFEVAFNRQTYTEYLVSESDQVKLLPQDSIKLIPELKHEITRAKFYSDGTSESETHITNPNGLLESWIEPIDKIIKTDSKIEAYMNGELLYTEMLVVDLESLVPPQHFAPFYMATNDWQLPLTPKEIDALQSSGYNVTINTATKLCIGNEVQRVTYNKSQLSEEYTTNDVSGNLVSRKLTLYKPDESGFLLYDMVITWTIDSRTEPCIEKITYETYSNISRMFHNPLCAPTEENGFQNCVVEVMDALQVSARQLEGSSFIHVSLPNGLPPIIQIVIKDLYGGDVMDGIEMETSNPFIDLGQLPTGVYHLSIKDQNVQSCKFLFQA